MNKDFYQAVALVGLAVVVAALSVQSFRKHCLSFSLLTVWLLVASLIAATPVVSWVSRGPARDLGISPTGVLLAIMVFTLLTALFRLSIDVTKVRQDLSASVRNSAISLAELPATWSREGSHDTAVVIPAYNEEGTVAQVIDRIRAQGFMCIVVDDGSADRTGSVALAAGAAVLRHDVNLGVGAALKTGFGYAVRSGATTVVQCDGDGQHDPSSIPELVRQLRDNKLDLVIGSRFGEGGSYDSIVSWQRKLAMSVLAWQASRATAVRITDPTSGFRAFSSSLAGVVANELGNHYLSDTFELVVRSGRSRYRVGECATAMLARQGGSPSVVGVSLGLYAARALLVVMFHLAQPFSTSGR